VAIICVWQVLELHGLTELPVRRPPQLHGNTHRSLQAGVRIGRGPEHNGHLSVHISLRKGASGLPARSREIHFNVLFLHLVTQQEDLIPTKTAPRVSVHSADLEFCSVGGTVVKDRMREDRWQAKGPA
jgi:hypothetical protein